MGQKKPLRYRDLRAILKTFGIAEHKARGKGSERLFVGVVNGQIHRYPTKCHGEGDTKPVPVINAIRRKFKITESDGVTDDNFYGRL